MGDCVVTSRGGACTIGTNSNEVSILEKALAESYLNSLLIKERNNQVGKIRAFLIAIKRHGELSYLDIGKHINAGTLIDDGRDFINTFQVLGRAAVIRNMALEHDLVLDGVYQDTLTIKDLKNNSIHKTIKLSCCVKKTEYTDEYKEFDIYGMGGLEWDSSFLLNSEYYIEAKKDKNLAGILSFGQLPKEPAEAVKMFIKISSYMRAVRELKSFELVKDNNKEFKIIRKRRIRSMFGLLNIIERAYNKTVKQQKHYGPNL